MSSPEFGWESLIDTDSPSGCYLRAALFTTYDRADERLLDRLVERDDHQRVDAAARVDLDVPADDAAVSGERKKIFRMNDPDDIVQILFEDRNARVTGLVD